MPHKFGILGCAFAFLLTSACVPSAGEAEKEFGENSPMAAIQADGRLIVAVPADAPPFAFTEGSGEPQGFMVDLAEQLAAELEVEAEYVETTSGEMPSLVAGPEPREIGDEEAHIAFPLTTITNQIYKVTSGRLGFDVTTPYFVSHQRILVPSGETVDSVDDLGGMKVCTTVDPEVGVPLDKLQPDARLVEVSTPRECAITLDRETVDAAVADELNLVRMLAVLEKRRGPGGFEIVGEQTTTQGYSPYVVRGMAAFASDVFNDVKDDGRWIDAYNEWIADLTGVEDVVPPVLTLEEAAAFYPEVTLSE